MTKTVYRNQEKQAIIEEAKKVINRVRQENNIPGGKYRATRIRGWSECSQVGINVSVGEDWQKAGYHRQEAKRTIKSWLKTNNQYPDVIYHDLPDCIIIELCVGYAAKVELIEKYYDRFIAPIMQALEASGLQYKIDTNSKVRVKIRF